MPENVPEVAPVGRSGNGRITGPFEHGIPKWMWPAMSGLVSGGLPASSPKVSGKWISVAALLTKYVAVPKAAEDVGGFSPAAVSCAVNIRSARAMPGADSSTVARAMEIKNFFMRDTSPGVL